MAVVELARKNDRVALNYAYKAYQYDKKNSVVAANLAVAYHYNRNFRQRDFYTKIAKRLGYKNIAGLQKIYKGILSVRD